MLIPSSAPVHTTPIACGEFLDHLGYTKIYMVLDCLEAVDRESGADHSCVSHETTLYIFAASLLTNFPALAA